MVRFFKYSTFERLFGGCVFHKGHSILETGKTDWDVVLGVFKQANYRFKKLSKLSRLITAVSLLGYASRNDFGNRGDVFNPHLNSYALSVPPVQIGKKD